jgi:pimeloyl-[acyl-carrier protein] synthase
MPAPDVDFQHVRELGNELLKQIDAVREYSPIFWSVSQHAWIVSGHAEVAEGFTGKLPFSNERMTKVARFMPDAEERARRIPTILRLYPLEIVFTDPPRQGRLRRLMMPAFSKPVIERNRWFIGQVVAEALDALVAGREVDFVQEVSNIIPGRVILRLIGLSEDYLPDLPRWSAAAIAGLGGGANNPEVLDAAEAVYIEMETALRAEVEKRRGLPTTDFLSTLMNAEFDGDRMTDDEVVAAGLLTILAGNDTTSNTLALSAVALAENPGAWEFMRAHPERMPDAVMEMMRYVAMSTTQTRTVVDDFEWHGHSFRKGQLVYLMIAGANRDPVKFAQPDTLDLRRSQMGNMTFGPGLHMCIGHLVARAQLEEFFKALVERFHGINLTRKELDWHSSLAFRGLRTLWLRLEAEGARTK